MFTTVEYEAPWSDHVPIIGAAVPKLKFLKAVPLVDVVTTGYKVFDDVHNNGEKPVNAVVANGADTLARVAAGAGVIALAPEAAPAILVAGVGAAVVFEATEAATALTREGHWGANIQQHGVVNGSATASPTLVRRSLRRTLRTSRR